MFQAVIGMNFGDEGKGRTVDYLVSSARKPALVIRHNSSAQAGHTVVVGDKRHVFSHFGSGTLRGADTLLCHKFFVNPILFNEEWDELEALGITPRVYVDSRCAMVSPLDTLLNRELENSRGVLRHGSVGTGFGEAVGRHLKGIDLTFRHPRRDLIQIQLERYFLQQVRERSIRTRVLESVTETLWDGKYDWMSYWLAVDLMMRRVRIVNNLSEFLRARATKNQIIFEAAQGLKLSQDAVEHGAPDHATWCNTGSFDILEVLRDAELDGMLDIHYVTRTYVTRHGAGPLEGETEMPDWAVCDTNVPNEWQGAMRFAPFQSYYVMKDAFDDWTRAKFFGEREVDRKIVLTCLDKTPGHMMPPNLPDFDIIFSDPENV